MAAAMILFVLTGAAPPVLVLTLIVMCYLTGWELWKEKELPFLWKAWWVLLVFLLNVVGLRGLLDLALRAAPPPPPRVAPAPRPGRSTGRYPSPVRARWRRASFSASSRDSRSSVWRSRPATRSMRSSR